MTPHPLSVLVVDDTVVYRKILSEVAGAFPDVGPVVTAPQGRLALAKMEASPADLVLLDVEMPEMDGLETLMQLRKRWPETAVVMISGANAHNRETTVRALEMGAMDFLCKPDGNDVEANRNNLRETLRPLLRHVQMRRNLQGNPMAPPQSPAPPRHTVPIPTAKAPPAPTARPHARPNRFDVLVLGVSTGGPNALGEVIPGLPGNLGIPVFIVQHMPPGFTASLARHLNEKSALTVKEATEGEPVLPNTVYVAPGGRHMIVRRFTHGSGETSLVVGLNDNPPENSCRPSVDVLFRSVAAQYEGNILSVVMTGMGSDGLEGVKALRRRGCFTLTQSEGTCVVYGMPMAVDEAGLSDESIPLPLLATRITHLIQRPGS